MGILDFNAITHSIASVGDETINFDPLTIGWWTFDETLEETYAGADFSPDTHDAETYKSFKQFDLLTGANKDRNGLLLTSGKSFSADIGAIASGDTYSLNLGFWYYSPKVLGFVRHAITKQSTPKTAPILAKANTFESAGQENVIPGHGEWIIREIGYSSTHNAIQIALCNQGSGPTAIFTSEPYEPGFHHVYINVKSDESDSQCYLRIDIDGGYGTQHVLLDSSVILINTSSTLTLNGINFGYTSHRTSQEGAYISNLIIQRKSSIFATKTILMMRFGPEIALTSDTEFPGFSFLGIGYDQPNTISTNQIFADGGSILLARSNGELLRGHRPIWDIEFAYQNPNVIEDLNASNAGDPPTWTPSGVRLRGGTIRI